jgi:hypothetical protein
MKQAYYVGLDIHRETIAYCSKTAHGEVADCLVIHAERKAMKE